MLFKMQAHIIKLVYKVITPLEIAVLWDGETALRQSDEHNGFEGHMPFLLHAWIPLWERQIPQVTLSRVKKQV